MRNRTKAAGAVGIAAAAAVGGKLLLEADLIDTSLITGRTIEHEAEDFRAVGAGDEHVPAVRDEFALRGTDLKPSIANLHIVYPSGLTDPRSKFVYSLFAQAEPRVLNDLAPQDLYGEYMAAVNGQSVPSEAEIEGVIRNDVATTIEAAEKQPNANITFEVFTGNLTINSHITVGGVKVTGGDVNVYKIGAVLAGYIAGCGLDGLRSCIDQAFNKIGDAINAEVGVNSSAVQERAETP